MPFALLKFLCIMFPLNADLYNNTCTHVIRVILYTKNLDCKELYNLLITYNNYIERGFDIAVDCYTVLMKITVIMFPQDM